MVKSWEKISSSRYFMSIFFISCGLTGKCDCETNFKAQLINWLKWWRVFFCDKINDPRMIHLLLLLLLLLLPPHWKSKVSVATLKKVTSKADEWLQLAKKKIQLPKEEMGGMSGKSSKPDPIHYSANWLKEFLIALMMIPIQYERHSSVATTQKQFVQQEKTKKGMP